MELYLVPLRLKSKSRRTLSRQVTSPDFFFSSARHIYCERNIKMKIKSLPISRALCNDKSLILEAWGRNWLHRAR